MIQTEICGLLDELNFNMLPWQLMIFTDMLFLSTVSFSSNRSSQPWLRQFHTRHCLCWSLLFISFSAGSTKDFRSLLCWWFYLWSLSSVPLEWNLCPRFRSWALFVPQVQSGEVRLWTGCLAMFLRPLKKCISSLRWKRQVPNYQCCSSFEGFVKK